MNYEKLKQLALFIVNHYNVITTNLVNEINKLSQNKININEFIILNNDYIYQIEHIDKPNKGENLCVYDFTKK